MIKKSRSYYSYLWILPALILYLLFSIVPTLQGIFYSFTYWNIFDSRFAGLDNYINILTNPQINIAFKNTILFTVITTFFKVFLGLILAIILNRKIRTANIMRTIYFMPAIVSNVAVALIFSSILHPDGIFNSFLRSINMDFLTRSWLTDTNLVMYSVSAIEIWKWTGFTMVILLAGLQTIPFEYYEAANIDGATAFDKFKSITFPLLMPAFNNAFIISLVGGLKVFDLVYALTGGGPGNASEVLSTYVFKAYGNGYYGEACAAGVIIGVLVSTISLATLKPLRAREVEV